MVFSLDGKPMKGWVLVEPEGVENDDQLSGWIQRAMARCCSRRKRESYAGRY